MEENTHMENSKQNKKRNPIFSKNDHSPVTKLTDSFMMIPSNNTINHTTSSIIPNTNRQSRIQMEKPQIKTNINQNIKKYSNFRPNFSQPKVKTPINSHIIYHQRPTSNIVPSPPIVTRIIPPQGIIQNIAQPQPVFAQPIQTFVYPNQHQQNLPIQTILRSSHHMQQTRPPSSQKIDFSITGISNQNSDSRLRVQPTVVAVQRVMKEIGNQQQKQFKYSEKHQTFGYDEQPTSPQFKRSGSAQLSKLSQLNNLLSQNYNILYTEFFNLKKDIKQQQVVEQNIFLKKSMRQIQNIFEVQTNQALMQIEQLYQQKRQPIKKISKSRAEIKHKYFYS